MKSAAPKPASKATTKAKPKARASRGDDSRYKTSLYNPGPAPNLTPSAADVTAHAARFLHAKRRGGMKLRLRGPCGAQKCSQTRAGTALSRKKLLPPEGFRAKAAPAQVLRHARYSDVRISRAGGRFLRPTEECAGENVGNARCFCNQLTRSWRVFARQLGSHLKHI